MPQKGDFYYLHFPRQRGTHTTQGQGGSARLGSGEGRALAKAIIGLSTGKAGQVRGSS